MSGSFLCARCSRVLEVQSASGLCETCLVEVGTNQETLQDDRPPVNVNLLATTVLAEPVNRTVDRTNSVPLQGPTLTVVPMAEQVSFPPAPPGYELLKLLGHGGMGVVYLARDQITERLVAMKFLQRTGHQAAYDRFVIELRALASVEHPNIIRVLGHDFLRANPYFIMEYAAGGSVSHRLKAKAPFQPRDAAQLIATTARAIHAANQAHVIHRDLKPSNILLMEDGSPRVSDFGLAKRLDRDDQLTTGSGAIGTPAYMAPEQARPGIDPVDARTDVYGLGATLYHLVTGEPPFSGTHDIVIGKVLNDTPKAPRLLCPQIPLALEAIILKCLEKKPANRYSSAEHLAQDLDRFLAGAAPEAPVLTRRRRLMLALRRGRQQIGQGVLLLLVLTGVFVLGAALWPKPKVVETPDVLEEINKELLAGHPVTLVGAKGMPRWHRWRLGPATLGESSIGDGSCCFQTNEWSLLELLPALPILRYQLTAELCHVCGEPLPPDGHTVPDMVGFYFGAVTGVTSNDEPIHSLFAVSFRDAPVRYPEPNTIKFTPRVRFSPYLILQRPRTNSAPAVSTGGGGGSVPFQPVDFRPGKWRRIVVDVTPESVLVQWQTESGHLEPFIQPSARPRYWTAAEIIGMQTNNRTNWIQTYKRDFQAPAWSPSQAFGIMSYLGTVAFRNVKIIPLANSTNP